MKVKRDDVIVIGIGVILFIILLLFIFPGEREASLGLAAIQNASEGVLATCTDFDNDGYKASSCGGLDCNDLEANINPEAEETCDNIDNNCNGEVDELFDYDNDGFTSCSGDCNDDDSLINPAASEVCDNKDNNCNNEIDEGCVTSSCTDNDFDGFYIESNCGPIDCNDDNPEINPASPEVCNDFVDNDCNTLVDYNDPACVVKGCKDKDNDGFAAIECGSIDCDDSNPNIHPGKSEVCNNALDDNCDGLTDLEDVLCR